MKQGYTFCLVDPEGDYLELPDVPAVGNETSVPSVEEIGELLKKPKENLAVCMLSVPFFDRPAFFSNLLSVLLSLRKDYGHPHWIILDEAHHLIPSTVDPSTYNIPDNFNNFIIITTSPGVLSPSILSKVGMIITVGEGSTYALEEFCSARDLEMPAPPPTLSKNEAYAWDLENNREPTVIRFKMPEQLHQRHKKKYALGDLGRHSFYFTGPENKLKLKAHNLMMFIHLAEGVDDATWLYHLQRNDFTNWFKCCIHDEDLISLSEDVTTHHPSAKKSKKMLLDYIRTKYTL